MQQHGAAFDMAQKAVANALAFGRPRDQPWDIRDDELDIVDANHAKVGVQRCERVVRDLRARIRRRSEEGRFARIGQPQKPRIGDQFEP